MAEAKRDGNHVPSLLGVSNVDNATPVAILADPATGALLTSVVGGGGGGTASTFGDAFPATGTAAGASDGTNMQPLLVDASGFLKVNVAAGGGAGGTSSVDGDSFTAGTSAGTPSMGAYHSTIDTVTDGDLAIVGITPKRAQFVNLQTAAGVETGVAAAPLQVSLANTAANATAVKVDGSAVTQPVSASSLPLPTGASTAAKQPALGTAGTASADVITIQGIASMTAVKVDGSAVTQPVSAASLPLPTGAATEATLSTLDGKVTACNTGAVTISAALPAGTNAIGKLAANSGVDIGDVDVTSVIAGTGATNLGKAEDAGHSTGDTGVFALAVRKDTLTTAITNTDADYSQISVDDLGRVQTTVAPLASMVRGTATTTGTSDTSLVAASGDAGLKTYITDIQIANTGATTSLITFKDGSGGSTLGYTVAPAAGGSNIHFTVPLVTTANTAFYFAAGSASTTIYASAQGFKAK